MGEGLTELVEDAKSIARIPMWIIGLVGILLLPSIGFITANSVNADREKRLEADMLEMKQTVIQTNQLVMEIKSHSEARDLRSSEIERRVGNIEDDIKELKEHNKIK